MYQYEFLDFDGCIIVLVGITYQNTRTDGASCWQFPLKWFGKKVLCTIVATFLYIRII